jgi:hypothetical protein
MEHPTFRTDFPGKKPAALSGELVDRLVRTLRGNTSAATEPDNDVPQDFRPRESLDSVLGRLAGYRALNAATASFRKCADAAREFATQRLRELVAECSDRFWASAAWLFLLDENEEALKVVVSNKVSRQYHSVVRLGETSIVSWIAQNKEPYLTNDVENDPHFLPTPNLDSHSAMGVPLVLEGRLLGVLHLESCHKGAFSAALLPDLAVEATEMAEHLLILEALDRANPDWCPWHPQLFRWDFSYFLRPVCHAIAEALDGGEGTNAIQCAILEVDRPNKELCVSATSGHMTEYTVDQTLAFTSFIGSMAECPAGAYGRAWPDEDHCRIEIRTEDGYETELGHRFLMDYKRTWLGVEDAVAVPVHLPSARGAREARFVLAVYAYSKQAVASLPGREEMTQIANLLGDVLGAGMSLREKVAVAYFTRVSAKRSSSDDLAPLCREMAKVYGLEELRCYVSGPVGDGLCALGEKTGTRPLSWQDGSPAYLTYLSRHPGVAVRVNDARSARPADLAVDETAGILPWNDPEHRRFLDIGVGGSGVLRLVRPALSRPFTVGLEETLRAVTPIFAKAFRERATTPESVGRTSLTTSARERGDLREAMHGFLSPVPVQKALAAYYERFAPPVYVGFVTKQPDTAGPLDASVRFRWHSYIQRRQRSQPVHPEDLVHRPELDWENLIERGLPATFNLKTPAGSVASGIRMPLLTWTGGRYLVEGVLALDFSGQIEWKEDDIVLLFHAAQQISSVMGRKTGRATGSARRTGPPGFGEACLQRLLDYPKVHFGQARSAVELLQWRQGKESPVILRSQLGSTPPDISWRPIQAGDDYELAAFGVVEGISEGHLACSIPLRINRCLTGRFICDLGSQAADARSHGSDDDRRRVFHVVRRIAGEAHRLWGRAFGLYVADNVSFDWDDSGTGSELVYWEPHVTWPPLFLGSVHASASTN